MSVFSGKLPTINDFLYQINSDSRCPLPGKGISGRTSCLPRSFLSRYYLVNSMYFTSVKLSDLTIVFAISLTVIPSEVAILNVI